MPQDGIDGKDVNGNEIGYDAEIIPSVPQDDKVGKDVYGGQKDHKKEQKPKSR